MTVMESTESTSPIEEGIRPCHRGDRVHTICRSFARSLYCLGDDKLIHDEAISTSLRVTIEKTTSTCLERRIYGRGGVVIDEAINWRVKLEYKSQGRWFTSDVTFKWNELVNSTVHARATSHSNLLFMASYALFISCSQYRTQNRTCLRHSQDAPLNALRVR